MSISWYGRAYIDEKSISPEQYKMFFDRCEFGIKFDIANMILKDNSEGNYNEVVPADELTNEARADIKSQIMSGNMSGEIELEGHALKWKWEPKCFDDGTPVLFDSLEEYVREKMVDDMLSCYYCGIID